MKTEAKKIDFSRDRGLPGVLSGVKVETWDERGNCAIGAQQRRRSVTEGADNAEKLHVVKRVLDKKGGGIRGDK
jgi:hypothetical protein